MKKRQLRQLPTQARLKELFHYDPETGKFYSIQNRRRWKAGRECGTNAGGYISINVDYVIYRAHRLAWMWMTGEDPGPNIDHVNGDSLDNRWSNKRVQSNSRTGVKGVHLIKGGKFRARVQFRGKPKDLGVFDTVEEAKAAYDAAAKIIHGSFHRSA
jgi:hypothetical protein